MAETELERAEKRFAQAKARVQALRNREATKQRKLDTRRKVILGGALVDLAARDDRAGEMLERLIRNLAREQDRAAFEGWDWRAEKSGKAEEVGDVGTLGETDTGGGGGAQMVDGGTTGVVPGADEAGLGNGGAVTGAGGGTGAERATVPDTGPLTAAENLALRARRLALSGSIGPVPNLPRDRPAWGPLPETSPETAEE